MMLALILESALRALLLGASVWLLLQALRLRDVAALTAIWTLVLGASLLMPALTALTPLHIVLPLPLHTISAVPTSYGTLAPAPAFAWQDIAAGLYGLIALLFLLRLATGLIVMAQIYRHSVAVTGGVRSSAALAVPVTFGTAILLPQDHQSWSTEKRIAVLAHERSHIQRGDFFILLLAGVHRALFWFNPFAWWLQHRLSELAETASDDAAIRRLGDPAGYAEILLEVSLRAQGLRAAVAMAKCPDISWRIERILSGAPSGASVSPSLRFLVLAALVPVSLTFAGAEAAVAPMQSVARLPVMIPPPANPIAVLPEVRQAAAPLPAPPLPASPLSALARHPVRHAKAAPARPAPIQESEVTYNPRALLDDPQVVVLPALSPVTGND